MDILPTQNTSPPHTSVEKSALRDYRDEYPIILYEPEIESEQKRNLKELIQGNRSIELFTELKKALKFAEDLGISFILLISSECDGETAIRQFGSLKGTYSREMFDFEEKQLFKDLFGKDNQIKFLGKAYVFWTVQDFMTEAPIDEDDVMIMSEIKKMAQKFKQESVVILYDPNLSTENREALSKEIDIEEANIYGDFTELEKRIYDLKGPPFHLVMTSKVETKKIISEMDKLKTFLLGLYVYSDDPGLMKIRSRKILVAKNTLRELIPKLKKGIRENSKLVNSFPAFATDFDAYDKSHLYDLHYYLKGLIHFKNRKQAKEDFLSLAKNIYESKKIFEFEKEYDEYNQKDIFRWYAMESPVYKLLNNCLRIATSDSILCCRYILKDLERAIREGYRENSYYGAVYRGAYIQKEEWEKLQKNIGKDIEMYGFLSTSQKLETAKKFLFSDLQNKILITIIIPPLPVPEFDEQGFANISQSSGFEEAEILFNVRAKFRIIEAGMMEVNAQGKECRHLVLLYGPHLLRRSMTLLQPMPITTIQLRLPEEASCNNCGLKENLFSFIQEGTRICCLTCLTKGRIPQDIPLLALNLDENLQENKILTKSFKGKIFKFTENVQFPFYGYKCHTPSCQGMGKEAYFKWIDSKTGKVSQQCSDCLKNGIKIEADILFSESNPYVLWQEHENEWEKADSDYQVELSEKVRFQGQDDVYMETQHFDLCIEYGERVCCKLSRKRGQEMKKFEKYEKLGKSYEKLGKHKKALEYHQEVTRMRKVIYGENSVEAAFSYNNLATSYKSLEDFKQAEEYLVKTLNIIKGHYGVKDPLTALAYNNVASMYQSFGKYQEALESFKEALDVTKEFYGENHPAFITSYSNLASAMESLGKHQQALENHQRALNISRAIYGERHPQTALSYNNLASVYQSFGKYQEALACFQSALDNIKGIYGENHPEIARYCHNIASVYRIAAQYSEALKYNNKALGIRKLIYGENHSETIASYHDIALVYKDLGKHKQAQEIFKKCLDAYKKIYGSGEKHPHSADFLTGLGATYQSVGDYEKALECNLIALKIREDTLPEKTKQIATSHNNIGSIYRCLGRYQEAIESHQKALAIREKLYGPEHPHTTTSYNNIGVVYESMGEYKEAKKYLERTLEIRREKYGEKHPLTATAYNNLASVHCHLKEYQQSQDYFKKALDIREAVFTELHPDTADSYRNLASVYQDLREHQNAIDYYNKALNIWKSIGGKSQPYIAIAYNLALIYSELENFVEARKYYVKVLRAKKEIYQRNDPRIAVSYSDLGFFDKHHLNNPEKALEYFKKAQNIFETTDGREYGKQIIALYSNLASTYSHLGDEKNALIYSWKTINFEDSVFGEKSSDMCGSFLAVYEFTKDEQLKAAYSQKAQEIQNFISQGNR